MPEADRSLGPAAEASARDRRGDEEPGADLRLEHLSRRAEHYSRVPRPRTRHGADDNSHVFRGRGETDTRTPVRGADLRADADRISARKVRTDQAPPGERGHVPGQVRHPLEGLIALVF